MSTDRWNQLSDWHNAWLKGDSAERRRLRDELISKSPDLVAEADALAAASVNDRIPRNARLRADCRPASDEAAMKPGTLVGPYQINALIARGGMGIVYRATDTRLDRQVALKLLAPLGGPDELRVERFLREARITASLDHPNIVKVYDVGTHDGQPFMVVELLEGETLRTDSIEVPSLNRTFVGWASRSPGDSSRDMPRASFTAISSRRMSFSRGRA